MVLRVSNVSSVSGVINIMSIYLRCDSNAKMKYSCGFALETPEGERSNNNRIGMGGLL